MYDNDERFAIRTFQGLLPLALCAVGSVVVFRAVGEESLKARDGVMGHITGFGCNSWGELMLTVKLAGEREAIVHPLNIEVIE